MELVETVLKELHSGSNLSGFILNAIANTLGTILGGIFLTILYYLVGNRLFRLPNLNGLWEFRSIYTRTKYNPFRNMLLVYKVVLLQEGNHLHGSAEMTYEKSDEERTYVGKHRQRLQLEGTIHKGYFGASQVFLHMNIESEKRESSGYAQLSCRGWPSRWRMEGLVSMTAGDSYGTLACLHIPITQSVDEYKWWPIQWFGRTIELFTSRLYQKEWEAINKRITLNRQIAKIIWKEFNCHLLVAALVLAEDKRFYSHGGVDPIGILRACWHLATRGKLEGASTIEQQFVRVVTEDYRRSILRKFKEMVLASRLHRVLDKEKIAIQYLMVAYCGWQMTGILRGARRLAIDLKQPSMRQAAAFVARIKYPQGQFAKNSRMLQIQAREAYIFEQLSIRKYLTF